LPGASNRNRGRAFCAPAGKGERRQLCTHVHDPDPNPLWPPPLGIAGVKKEKKKNHLRQNKCSRKEKKNLSKFWPKLVRSKKMFQFLAQLGRAAHRLPHRARVSTDGPGKKMHSSATLFFLEDTNRPPRKNSRRQKAITTAGGKEKESCGREKKQIAFRRAGMSQ